MNIDAPQWISDECLGKQLRQTIYLQTRHKNYFDEVQILQVPFKSNFSKNSLASSGSYMSDKDREVFGFEASYLVYSGSVN